MFRNLSSNLYKNTKCIASSLRYMSKERANKAIRPGNAIVMDGEPYKVLKMIQGKRGKGGGFVRGNFKSLISGQLLEKTYSSDDTVEVADLETEGATYSWTDGTNCYFMNNETYEEISVPSDDIETKDFLLEGINVKCLKFNNKVIGVDLPMSYDYQVVDVDVSKSSGGMNLVTLNSGAKVYVPTFIEKEEMVKINVHEGTYIERSQK